MSDSSYIIKKSDINYSGGRYMSTSPYAAAKKAASQLFRKIHNDAKFKKFKSLKTIKFTLRETTSGSSKKEFSYKSNQIKLATPVTIVINGVKIQYKYKINIISLNKENYSKKGGGEEIKEEIEINVEEEIDVEDNNVAEDLDIEEDNNAYKELVGGKGKGKAKGKAKAKGNNKAKGFNMSGGCGNTCSLPSV